MFEKVPKVEGRPLAAQVRQGDPRKALLRGVAVIRSWLRRAPGITPNRCIGRLSYAALVLASAMPTTHFSEEELNLYLRDYSLFCRATSALWDLRLAHDDYRELAENLLGTKNEAAFAHDEFVLFITAQLRASGVAVRPTPATGDKRPDLHVPNALVHGGILYWECKERNPAVGREPTQLLSHFRRALSKGSKQIQLREKTSRGIVSIDMGAIQHGQEPPQHEIVVEIEKAMTANDKLVGVSISATSFVFVERNAGLSLFQPVFRSQLRLSRWALEGRYRLRPEVADGIQHAMLAAL